jgi:S1-C subfamily serine protease
MVDRVKSFSRTPFGSGIVGGLVVAVLGWIAIAAGLVHASSDQRTVATPLTPAPVPIKSTGHGETVAQIYKADSAGVAFIQAQQAAKPPSPFDLFGLPRGGGTATGSGFVIDTDGHILTNNHVVAGAQSIHVKLGRSNTSYSAQIIGRDPATDLALLKISASSSALHPLTLGDSSTVQVGDPMVAIGNPFGLDQTATTGIVSALQRQIQAPNGFAISNVIQTDASINPGNSGGPLIDASGDVIGITSQIETAGGGGSVGIGFAIPSNTARQVVDQLEKTGKVEHAFLGITGATISPDIASALNLPVKSGVLVQQAVNGGPAATAGIRGGTTAATIGGASLDLGGDILTAVNGHRLNSMDQLANIVNAAKPGDTLQITARRGSATRTVTVTLGDRPNSISGSSLGR